MSCHVCACRNQTRVLFCDLKTVPLPTFIVCQSLLLNMHSCLLRYEIVVHTKTTVYLTNNLIRIKNIYYHHYHISVYCHCQLVITDIWVMAKHVYIHSLCHWYDNVIADCRNMLDIFCKCSDTRKIRNL